MGWLEVTRRWLGLGRSVEVPKPRGPRDLRPADGRVDLARLAACEGIPNSSRPEFRRFTRFDPTTTVTPCLLRRGWPNEPRPLLGRIVVVSLFLGRYDGSWSDVEIAYAHRALERAASWIERQAMRWKAAVNVELAEFYFVSRDDADEDVAIEFAPRGGVGNPFGGVVRGEDVDLYDANDIVKIVAGASRAAAELGFSDVADLVARTEARIHADATVWLLHLRCEGRSMAIPERATALAGVNLAACYAREADLPGPLNGPVFSDPITFAHEILHLFGAEDKYGVPLSRYDRRLLSDRDIMVLAHESLSRLRIDPLTALELGWPEEAPA